MLDFCWQALCLLCRMLDNFCRQAPAVGLGQVGAHNLGCLVGPVPNRWKPLASLNKESKPSFLDDINSIWSFPSVFPNLSDYSIWRS